LGDWNIAVMTMIAVSAMGFLLSDGELRRVAWIRAMRKCMARLNCIIRYEQPDLYSLLRQIDLHATPQERQLSRLLHACAERMQCCTNPQLLMLFTGEASRYAGFGVLSEEDRSAFEAVIAGLGRSRMPEQIQLIESADEQLRSREEVLMREGKRRAQMIRSLGLAAGAAMFLILV